MLSGDGEEVGGPVSGRAADDRPQLTSASVTAPTRPSIGAADRRAPVHSPVGSAPDRVPPRDPESDGRAGPGPVPDAVAASPRPEHRPAGQGPEAGPIRTRLFRASWSTSTSRSSAASRTAAAGGSTGAGQLQTERSDAARAKAAGKGAAPSRGYRYLHHAIDDHSRVVYSEILDNERKETASEFWVRARAFFTTLGITVTEVMTDNGSCYRSHAFADALGNGVKHRRTRPYRPQTNGKVERFNRTLAAEWAYAASYTSEAHEPDLRRLAASLQPPPTPHRHRRQDPRITRSQRPEELHLEPDQKREAEGDHDAGDDRVEHPPGRGPREERAQQARPEAEGGEPEAARDQRADGKPPPRAGPCWLATEPRKSSVSR